MTRESRELEESKARSNEKSQAIFENIKARKIEEFFSLMDADQDGQISAGKIEISKLPIFALEKLAPMLYEMEQMNITLDFLTFQSAFLKLINVKVCSSHIIFANQELQRGGEKSAFFRYPTEMD